MDLVLASASPRRQAILQQLGFEFSVQASDASEDLTGIPPLDAPRLLAQRKALAVSKIQPGKLVLGYDTLVFRNLAPLGKPSSPEDAFHMLWSLRNRKHQVITGFAAARDGVLLESGQESTWVVFRLFSKHELDDYIAGGEPFDKAGAYGIQGQGARFVKAI
jgi:septum formation protein